MLRGAVDAAQSTCEAQGVELTAKLPARPVPVDGDAARLSQLIDNLLGNAWKYSAERAVAEIGFELREVAGEAVYRVHDNGIGFDMAHAAKIFELSQAPQVKDMLLKNTQSAHDRGAFGSPSFLVGDQLWFGKERLRDVEEEVVRVASA